MTTHSNPKPVSTAVAELAQLVQDQRRNSQLFLQDVRLDTPTAVDEQECQEMGAGEYSLFTKWLDNPA